MTGGSDQIRDYLPWDVRALLEQALSARPGAQELAGRELADAMRQWGGRLLWPNVYDTREEALAAAKGVERLRGISLQDAERELFAAASAYIRDELARVGAALDRRGGIL